MPRLASLGDMQDRVRQETDQEQSTFVTDAELTTWINQGIAEVWRLLTSADPNRGITTATISCTSGTTEYALPNDFMAIRGLDYPLGGGRYISLEPYAFAERNQLTGSSTAYVPIRYLVMRGSVDNSTSRLSLLPDPGTVDLRLWYVAVPALLSLSTDDFDGIAGFEDYPIAWAASRVRKKAEEDPSIEFADLARIESRITSEAGRRDRTGLEHVARIRGRVRQYPYP